MKTLNQKNNLIISTLIVVFTLFAYLDSNAQLSQGSNTLETGNPNFNSAIGLGNTALSDSYYSTAGGQNSTVNNSYYSLAFGKNAYTEGRAAFALGEYARSEESYSFAFGRYITADASKCFVFGTGTGSGDGQILTNNVENSFLVGFDNKKMLMVRKRTGFLGSGEEYGLVGINTDTPQYELDVVGTANVEQFRLHANATSGYVLVSDADGLATWQDKAGRWSENSNGIDYSGNVGIGTTSPATDLDVAGYIRSENLWLTGDSTSLYFPHNQAFNFITYDESGKGISTPLPPNSCSPTTRMTIAANGNIGIGTETPSCDLEVEGQTYINGTFSIGTTTVPSGCVAAINGKLLATEIKIATYQSSEWSDFVFEDGYTLRPLENVKAYIAKNGHLPDVPSSKQIEEEGYEVADMDAILLQKIEELTLYVIEQHKEIEDLKMQVVKLNKQ